MGGMGGGPVWAMDETQAGHASMTQAATLENKCMNRL
jgi:hypothetical protein